jgi:hypothetical protein
MDQRVEEEKSQIRAIAAHVLPTECVQVVATDPDNNRVLECAAADARR